MIILTEKIEKKYDLVLELDLEVFNDIIKNRYEETIEELKQEIINNKEGRMEPYIDNIPKSNYLTLLILAKPFKESGYEFTEDFLVNPTDIDGYYDYFNKCIDKFILMDESIHIINESFAYIIDELTIFSNEHIITMDGPSISLYDVFDVARKDEEFDRIIKLGPDDIDPQLTYKEVITKVQEPNKKKAIDILSKVNGLNDFKTFLKAGTGINKNQLNEAITLVGYKPDIKGNIDTNMIATSFIKGLLSTENFSTDAESSINALYNSKNKVRESGYLNRKVTLSTSDIKLSQPDEEKYMDCGSKYLMTLDLRDHAEDKLRRINNRTIIHPDTGELYEYSTGDEIDERIINGEIDRIQFRTPSLCALPNGKVCHTCYGKKLAKVNLTKSIGTIAALKLTEPMTQKLLSTKHLNFAVIDSFEWTKEFLENFEFVKDTIKPRNEKLKIFVNEMYVDEDRDFNRYRLDEFKFKVDNKGKEISVKAPFRLSLPDRNVVSLDNKLNEELGRYEITMKDLNADCLFETKIKNQGVADPLLSILSILERSDKIRNEYDSSNYIMMYNDITNHLINSGTDVMSVHLEVIMRNMIFPNNNYKDRALFTDPESDIEFTIRNIGDSIIQSPSPILSIIFEKIKAQLITDETNNFFSKNEESMFDSLFDFMYEK